MKLIRNTAKGSHAVNVIPQFTSSTVISEMRADIRVAQDYSPFGVTLDGRNFVVSEGYRYGYQGYERDNEVKGEGNSYNTEYRQYDPRLGRWLSLDPRKEKYPAISPYVAFGNNPIMYVDTGGDTIRLPGTKAQMYLTLWFMQKLTNDDIVLRDGLVVIKAYNVENKSKKLHFGTKLIRELISHEKTVTISVGKENSANYAYTDDKDYYKARNGQGANAYINFDPTANPDILTKDKSTGIVSEKKRPDEIGLAHEMIHTLHMMNGDASYYDIQEYRYKTGVNEYTYEYVNKEELRTVGLKFVKDGDITENQIRQEQGLETRGAY